MDLRVMSPTSYQTALSRVVIALFNIADTWHNCQPILQTIERIAEIHKIAHPLGAMPSSLPRNIILLEAAR